MHIKTKTLLLLVLPIFILFAVAYIQWGISGIPNVPDSAELNNAPILKPFGFPLWLRMTHYINFLLIILLIRSGLQILADHPRLYWELHCTPGSEWARFTPVKLPSEGVWTAKQDSRYLSPWIGLPGRRHSIGMARHWHFLSILFWILNGLTFIFMLLYTPQWQRLVPTSWKILPDAWAVFTHYATFHLPPEPNGFYNYNALQQLSYFAVVFILAPLAILTGPSMSPAFTAGIKWYPRLPGNRQIGRSLHFLTMCGFVAFIILHVTMVAVTGLTRNMNHIVMGTDNTNPVGLYLGLVGILAVVGINALAYWAAWKHPRNIQHAAKAIVAPVTDFLFNQSAPIAEFKPEDISPFFWANGKVPTTEEWKAMAAGDFKDYRLKVSGLVENKVNLTLNDLRTMKKKEQITLHHCIQGWSGIAEWGGVQLSELIKLVKPKPNAKAVVFYSFGEGGEGGQFYDSLSIQDALNSQTLLAYEMNYKPLNDLHGAPLRLRVENQLGFKMVKWIQSISFVEDIASVNMGEGGYNEDHEYFGEQANI
ncbi:MAG: molybdopterin-dependent oxidoreductase [Bacteroidota bacterium]|nr:molybdopterin-dependent oxidoreductase [Bacteroidota bacterium]